MKSRSLEFQSLLSQGISLLPVVRHAPGGVYIEGFQSLLSQGISLLTRFKGYEQISTPNGVSIPS